MLGLLLSACLFWGGEEVVVVTRDGRTIKGTLVEETAGELKINRKGVQFTLPRSEILRVTRNLSPAEPPAAPAPDPAPPTPPPEPPIPAPPEPGAVTADMPKPSVATLDNSTEGRLAVFATSPPNAAEAKAFWASLGDNAARQLRGLELDKGSALGLSLLLESQPLEAPLAAWTSALQILPTSDGVPTALMGLGKLPLDTAVPPLLEALARSEGQRASVLRNAAQSMVAKLQIDQRPRHKELLLTLATQGHPQSLALARLLFEDAWSLAADEWLKMGQSADEAVRVESLMQMALKHVTFVDLTPLDSIYLKCEDSKTRIQVIKILDVHGKGHGSRLPGVQKAFLEDARKSKDQKLKTMAFDRLKLETGATFPISSEEWDQVAK